MNASLGERLKGVKWGQFKYSDVFNNIKQGRRLKKDDQRPGKIPFIMAGTTNAGVVNFVSNPVASFPPNAITIDIFGNTFYRNHAFGASDDTGVYWNDQIQYSPYTMLFFAVAMQISLAGKFSYGKKLRSSQSKAFPMYLPTTDSGEIDFAFMDSFIAALEAERMSKLSASLTASGLNSCKLSSEELNALQRFRELGNKDWEEYKMGDLFERIATNKLPYKADDLPKRATGKYVLPCLTSSFQNQGLNYYAPREGATVLRHVISLPSNSDVYRAYYQSREFTVLSDAYAIRWKLDETALTPNQYLFMVMCINKVTDLPVYSYKNKLGGWNVVKDKYIMLPQKDGSIDFAFMETFISALRKQAIQDVVRYTNRQIEATKSIVMKQEKGASTQQP